jgi:predicted GIY-YIG superfamily endonuclease
MSTIYILKLENDCYYVGRTKNLEERIKTHKNGLGPAWTQKNKFVSIYKILENQDPFEEDKQVKMMMAKFGIEYVRGGAYSSLFLSNIQKDLISKEIISASDLCYKCNKPGHFSNACPNKRSRIEQEQETFCVIS